MRVLIAEDDLTSRSILSAVLKKWGYETVITTDGDAAWEILRQPGAPPSSCSTATCRGREGSKSAAGSGIGRWTGSPTSSC